MGSPSMEKPRVEPQPILNDEKPDPGSSSPTLYDKDENADTTTPEGTVPKDDVEEYVSGWKLISLMISITVAAFLMLLDMSIITTAIPRITEQFHSLDDIGWYGSAYNLASLCPESFYINLPIGAVCAVLILLVNIPDRVVHTDEPILTTLRTKLDLIGFVIFAPCTVMFLLALQWGGLDYSWDSATVIGLFCGGGVTLIIFVFWERRVGDAAMIPLLVVRKREVWTSCLTMLFLFTSVFISSYYFPIYFQSVKSDTPFQSGVNLLPSILGQIVAAISCGLLIQRVGFYLPFGVLSGVVIAIASGLLTTLAPHTSTAKWAGYQILIGFGRGIGMQTPILAIQANTPPEITSVATAVLVFSQTFGGAVFISIANVIFNNKLKDELTARLPHLDADTIINAGATGVTKVVSSKDLPGALAAYAKGVDSAFYLSVAAGCIMFVTAWGMGWKDLRKKAPVKEGDA
ncbi:hypothetical protein G7Z17_g11790 [Cylindrodendrum hubeiense]|uniref:Uncharacterized protein n=1 Tax=Cylindrodendrum hubeiense TaxID=595255 RepID=A0A9P5GV98_9HYPO|nr:hypothetical protein G7Z17_g11790 [Cylindrodendrum hubeiense]